MNLEPRTWNARALTRRQFFRQSGLSLGVIALGGLLSREGYAGAAPVRKIGNPLAPQKPPFAPRAKSIIYLHMSGAPSMGSWLTYGLGTETQDLPGFVVLLSGGTDPTGGKSLWGSGFLPSVYQGVQCRSAGEPILFANNPAGMDRSSRRRTLDALDKLDELEVRQFGDPETLTRISQYELAYRMQISVPEVFDISKEPLQVHELYGAKPGEAS